MSISFRRPQGKYLTPCCIVQRTQAACVFNRRKSKHKHEHEKEEVRKEKQKRGGKAKQKKSSLNYSNAN